MGAWNERYVEKSTVRFKGLRTEDQIRVHRSRKTQGGPPPSATKVSPWDHVCEGGAEGAGVANSNGEWQHRHSHSMEQNIKILPGVANRNTEKNKSDGIQNTEWHWNAPDDYDRQLTLIMSMKHTE